MLLWFICPDVIGGDWGVANMHSMNEAFACEEYRGIPMEWIENFQSHFQHLKFDDIDDNARPR